MKNIVLLAIGMSLGMVITNVTRNQSSEIPNPIIYTVTDVQADDKQEFEVYWHPSAIMIKPYDYDDSTSFPIEITKTNGEIRVFIEDAHWDKKEKKSISVRVNR